MKNLNSEIEWVVERDKKVNIYERAFVFAVNVANFLCKVNGERALDIYRQQLIRSSSSIGANLAEADGALTKRDFINKVGIARREAKESRHWLLLIRNVSASKKFEFYDELDFLIKESHEILLILSSIISNAK